MHRFLVFFGTTLVVLCFGVPGVARGSEVCTRGAEELARGQFVEAERLLRQCTATASAPLTAFLQLCGVYQQQGASEQLYETALRGLKRFPTEKRFYLTAGAHAGRTGKFQQAVTIFQEAHRRWPDDGPIRGQLASAHYGEGSRLLDAGDNEAAEKELRRAVELAPEDEEARLNLGRALHNLNRTEEALAEFERLIQQKSVQPLLYFHRGLVLQRIGRLEPAVADFTAEIARRPDYPPAYLLRGLARLSLGATAEALPDLVEAVAKMPEDAHAQHALARCLLRLNRASEAEAPARKAVSLAASDPAPLLTLSRVLGALGRMEEAKKAAVEAAELSRKQRSAAPGEVQYEGDPRGRPRNR